MASGKNVFIGSRYAPVFDGEWDSKKSYEPLTVVQHKGASFTSKTSVPVGADINDDQYWFCTGNYNAQVEKYRQEVAFLSEMCDNAAVVNVMNYGFDNEGKTDNAAKLTNLIKSGCRCFYFPSGVYGFSNFNYHGVSVIGNGAVIKSLSGNNDPFAKFENGVIRGIEFVGKVGYYQDVLTVKNCEVIDCKVHGTKSNGIRANGGIVSDCEIYDVQSGVVIGGNNVTVRDCEIHDNTAHGVMVDGLYISNIKVENCHIHHNGSSGFVTAFVDPSNGTVGSTYVEVRGCTIHDNRNHGIELRSNYFVIDGNILISNGAGKDTQGIVVQSGFGCISNNEVGHQKGVGIDLGNVQRVTVTGNNVHDCYSCGIEVNYSNDVSVSGNVVTGNWTVNNDSDNRAGIWVRNGKSETYWIGENENVTVVGNTVTVGANQNYQLYIDGTSKNVVAVGNMLKSDLNVAILNESPAALVENNLI